MMRFQFNSSNALDCDEDAAYRVEQDVRRGLSRYEHRLTRVEVHVRDENAAKESPGDKHCRMEARANGLAPVAVTHDADSVGQAVAGATTKMIVVLDRVFGKLTNRKGH